MTHAATMDGRAVIGGGFRFADTHGFPFPCFVEACRKNGTVPSYPHYFAEAVESGWTADQAFERMREAHNDDTDKSKQFDEIKASCIGMFMLHMCRLSGERDARVIAKAMRLDLESRGVYVAD